MKLVLPLYWPNAVYAWILLPDHPSLVQRQRHSVLGTCICQGPRHTADFSRLIQAGHHHFEIRPGAERATTCACVCLCMHASVKARWDTALLNRMRSGQSCKPDCSDWYEQGDTCQPLQRRQPLDPASVGMRCNYGIPARVALHELDMRPKLTIHSERRSRVTQPVQKLHSGITDCGMMDPTCCGTLKRWCQMDQGLLDEATRVQIAKILQGIVMEQLATNP